VKRHTHENYDKVVHSVQEMEEKMVIEDRWTWESQEYKEAVELVATRQYRGRSKQAGGACSEAALRVDKNEYVWDR
jgi:coenzyme F420-reducing hydrogenase beta subunit